MAKYGTKDYVEELLAQSPSFVQSADTLAVKDKMTEYEGKIPTEPYKGTYTEQINNMVSSYLGRDKFNYNPNNDATYQHLRDTYLQGGKTAMQDTLGSGAILSGGNNNSAAQVAAQQVYNNYAKKVSDAIPALEAEAYSRFRTDLADKLQDINLLSSLDDKEYSREQDEVSKIYNLLNYYGNKYQSSLANDQTQHGNNLNVWGQKLSAGQGEYQNTKTDILNLLTAGVDVDYAVGESVGLDKNTMDAIKNAVKASASVSSGGGSGSSGSGTTYSKTALKTMYEDGDYDSLLKALSSTGMSLEDAAYNYGFSAHVIKYLDGDLDSLEQVDYLLKNYAKEGIPSTVSTKNAYTEDEFYAFANLNSQYNTYSDYLMGMFGKYIDLKVV